MAPTGHANGTPKRDSAPLDVRVLPVESLKPVAWNPRKHLPELIEKLQRNLLEFGWLEPIVVNEDMTVIGGHQRLKAAHELGMTEVPCVVVSLPKRKEKPANLSLNKLNGEWDEDKLELVLAELTVDELELAGFANENDGDNPLPSMDCVEPIAEFARITIICPMESRAKLTRLLDDFCNQVQEAKWFE